MLSNGARTHAKGPRFVLPAAFRFGFATACVCLTVFGASSAGAGGGPGKGGRKADRSPPTISITLPAAGATLTGAATVSGTAADNVQVARIDVSVDSGPYQSASGTSSWTFSVNTTAYSDGAHAITARASDSSGNQSTASVAANFSNAASPPPPPPADATPPAVAIAAPAPGATVSGMVPVAGTASDNASLAKVEVNVDGGAYQPAQGTSSWSYSLDSTAYADGNHTVAARATDTSGNVSSTSETVSVKNAITPPPLGVSQQLVTPEGVTIQISSDVTGWTPQQIYDLLKPNALELQRIGPSLTVKVQTQYASQTTASASESNGVYSNFRATLTLQAKPGTVFTDRPDYIVAHEYGHVWTLYHLYMSQHGDWTTYLVARSIATDPRLGSTYNWSKIEMIADDYRMLFGTSAAVSQSFYINPDVPDPRNVPGLRDFLLSVWAGS